jgi:hypothetical protein
MTPNFNQIDIKSVSAGKTCECACGGAGVYFVKIGDKTAKFVKL